MSSTTIPRSLTWRERTAITAARRWRGLARGNVADPAWARAALLGLLILTAAAYLWNLTASADANSFYAAAVQAGTKSWKAFFFGSIDSSNFITVDKPPASLWVMALSGRIFGFSSASMLVPQVLEGVLAVWLLAVSVKRWFGAGAGCIAGALLATTPVAALMFRFNNPDALLVCLLVASAACLVRALESGRSRWMVAVGTLLGFAFLAKMMQAFLVLPGFVLVYVIAAPGTPRRRLQGLLIGAAATVASTGWWVAAVALWPAASRPMIDGSSDNSILNLIVGYNGLARIFGSSGPGGGGGVANFSGATGPLRLFDDLMGGQAAWLLPASGLALVAGLWWRRRAPRTDRARAALILWGSWLLVSGTVFSLGRGVIHTYYTVAIAPAIAALVAIGGVLAWRAHGQLIARGLLAAGVAVTAGWAVVLLDRTPSWSPWLRPLVMVAGVAACGTLLAPAGLRRLRCVRFAAVALTAVACLAGPVAYSAQTIAASHTGSVPSAGPASAAAGGGPGGAGGAGRSGDLAGGAGGSQDLAGAAGIQLAGPTGRAGAPGGAASAALRIPAGATPGGAQVSAALVKALERTASRYRWVAATSGSQSAASLELATGGDPVMAIGGFNNEGGNLSLSQFKRYVAARDIHLYIVSSAGGGAPGAFSAGGDAFPGVPGTFGSSAQTGMPPRPGGPGGGSATTAITAWVEDHFSGETIGGETVYNLTEMKG